MRTWLRRTSLERHQVAIYLCAFVAGGLAGTLTSRVPAVAEHLVTPALAALLFLTFLQVPVAGLVTAWRDWRFTLALVAINFVAVPAVVAVLALAMPESDPVRLGMLIVLLCPCVDYVIVFSGLAGARSDRLLAATPLLLVAQFLLLPVYLTMIDGRGSVDTIDPTPFAVAFVSLIVVPLMCAWAVQWWAHNSTAREATVRRLEIAMVPLMALVVALVAASQVARLGADLSTVAGALWIYVVFLVLMPAIGWIIGRALRLDTGSIRAVAFSGATRNSLVVLPLALSLDEGARLAATAVVAQTAVELVGMVVFVRVIPLLIRARSYPRER